MVVDYITGMRSNYAKELALPFEQILITNLTCDGVQYAVPATAATSANITAPTSRRLLLLADLELETGLNIILVSQNKPEFPANGISAKDEKKLQAKVDELHTVATSKAPGVLQRILQDNFNTTGLVKEVQRLTAVSVQTNTTSSTITYKNGTKAGDVVEATLTSTIDPAGNVVSLNSTNGTAKVVLTGKEQLIVSGTPCGTCELAHAVEKCSADDVCLVASCFKGYGDCNADPVDGCETNTATAVEHCGACSAPCALDHVQGHTCIDGKCSVASCSSGYGDCNQVASDGCETDVMAYDAGNCGACAVVCADSAANHTRGVCSNGTCGSVCFRDFADCDALLANGCEADLLSSANHCGTCNTTCTGGMDCNDGLCVCPSGQSDCSGTCYDSVPGCPGKSWKTIHSGSSRIDIHVSSL